MARRVLIVGGGYAGAMCAIRMARKAKTAGAEIVLIDARPWFVERIRLHETVAGASTRRRSFAELLAGTGVRLRVGLVREIDLQRRRACFDAEPDETFDDLVLATGSIAASPAVPGLARAWSCATEESALALRAHLDGLPRGRVVIIGGGHTGTELATELAERRPDLRVTLLSGGEIAPALSPSARAHVRRALQRSGVQLREQARVVALEHGAVVLASGDDLPSDATVWCGGFRATPLAHDAGLETDDLGRAFVDARLRSTSHDFVRVIGDAARVTLQVSGEDALPVRMACASAMPQGAFCADDFARELTGRPPERFSFAYPGQCSSLGRRNAVIQLTDALDAPHAAWLGGRLGAFVKEMVCRYTVASLRLERRGIGYSWRKLPASSPGASKLLATRSP